MFVFVSVFVCVLQIADKNALDDEWKDFGHNFDKSDDEDYGISRGTPVNFETPSSVFSTPESSPKISNKDTAAVINPALQPESPVVPRKNIFRDVYNYLQEHPELIQDLDEEEEEVKSQEPANGVPPFMMHRRLMSSSSSFLYPDNYTFNSSEVFVYNSSEPTFCPESDVLFLIEESDESSWNSSMEFIVDVIEDIDISGIRYGIIRYNGHSLVYLTFSASELMDKTSILQLINDSLKPSFDNDNTNNDDNDLANALFEAFELFDTDSDDTRQKVLITLTSGVPDSYIGNSANTCDDDLFPPGNNPFIVSLVELDIHHVLVVYGDPFYVDYGAVECLVSDTEEYMLTLPFGSINLGNDTNNEIKDFADDVAELTCFSPTTLAPSNQPSTQPTLTPTVEPTSFVFIYYICCVFGFQFG